MSEHASVRIDAAGGAVELGFDDENDHIARVIRATGDFYEADMLADIRSRLFFPACAVDAGAHVGNHTLYFARLLEMETRSFEPDPANFRRLSHNVSRNGVEERCVLRNAGLGAVRSRAVSVGGSEGNSGMRALAADPDGPVEVTTIDAEVLELPRVDLLKIDVEGWEVDVLHGAAETLRRHRPLVYVEAGRETFPALSSLMEAKGYIAWKRFNVTPTFLFLPRERLGRR